MNELLITCTLILICERINGLFRSECFLNQVLHQMKHTEKYNLYILSFQRLKVFKCISIYSISLMTSWNFKRQNV